MTTPAWRLGVMGPAQRQLNRLPAPAAAAIIEALLSIRENPHLLGEPLVLEHGGRLSARRGPYRIIYEIDDAERLVRVVAIGHRRDVYRSA